MNMMHLLRAAALCASAALLAACGGGGGTATTAPAATATPTPFASPAMFVPAGSASISMPLSCTGSPGATSATLAITADGDLIFSGVLAGSTTVAEIMKIKYAEATYKYIDTTYNEGDNGAYVELEKDSAEMYAYWRNDGSYTYFRAYDGVSTSYGCSLPNGSASFSLKRELTEARLAATMLKGVTAISNQDADYTTLMNGVAYWESEDAPDSIRYFALNLSTGVMTGNPTPTVPHDKPTNLRLALPTTASTYGFFFEEDDEGEKEFLLDIRPVEESNTCIYFRVLGSFIEPESYCD
jgi:hypothetical protein